MWQVARKTVIAVTASSLLFLIILQLQAVWTSLEDSRRPATTVESTLSVEKEMTTTEPTFVDGEQSSCSHSATARGPGQRVVSFNFYGMKNSSRHYFQGIEWNAQLVSEVYPGWLMRVYHKMEDDDSDLQRLASAFPHLDLCDVTRLPGIGSLADKQPNTWRFLPLCDPLVDIFLSRDLDSHVSLRERAAVDEWLISGLRIHVMRDHPAHKVPLLAGMWGARLVGGEDGPRRFCEKLTRLPAGKKLQDQQVLWKVLWPQVKGDVMQHDSYSCLTFNKSHGNVHAWPTQRLKQPLNFVGSRDGIDKKPMMNKCPEVCRPRNHKNWTSC